MSACVSPPQLSTSHIVQVAASMAHAASTALPPRSKIMAPAVAARGLPVMAIQCTPCNGGFWVVTGKLLNDCAPETAQYNRRTNNNLIFFMTGWVNLENIYCCSCVQFRK